MTNPTTNASVTRELNTLFGGGFKDITVSSKVDRLLKEQTSGTTMIKHASDDDISHIATSIPVTRRSGNDGVVIVGASCDIDIVSGAIDITAPLSARSDAAGYARMIALQHGKKELIRLRLVAKLESRKTLGKR